MLAARAAPACAGGTGAAPAGRPGGNHGVNSNSAALPATTWLVPRHRGHYRMAVTLNPRHHSAHEHLGEAIHGLYPRRSIFWTAVAV